MNKKLEQIIVAFSIMLILCVALCGCQEHQSLYPTRIRLADDYNSDWTKEAIGEVDFESSKNHIKVAIIDTGSNNDSLQIIEKYNVVSNDNNAEDESGHESIISQKFLDLNCMATVINRMWRLMFQII